MTRRKKALLWGTVFLLLLPTVLPFVLITGAPEHCLPRHWVYTLGLWSALLWGLLTLAGVIALTVFLWRHTRSRLLSCLTILLLWAVTLYLGLAALLFILFGTIPSDTEAEDYGETVLVRRQVWLDRASFALYQKEGPFYLRWVCDITPPGEPDPPQPSEPEPPPEDDVFRQQLRIVFDGACQIQCSLRPEHPDWNCARKELNARGVPRLILWEDGTDQVILEYDRAHGAYLLYDLYRTDGTTVRLCNTYACSVRDGRVIASGKQNWSDPASPEYEAALKEEFP